MEIVDWRLLYRLLGPLMLLVIAVLYSFVLVKRSKNCKIYQVCVWGIACFTVLCDIIMHLLFYVTNVFNENKFPILSDAHILLLIAGIFVNAMIYLAYFQWNVICEYKLDNKPVSHSMQINLQKYSAFFMYTTLLLHFLLYGIFLFHSHRAAL